MYDKIRCSIVFLFLFYYSPTNAQNEKTIFLELAGRGVYYSVNFDLRFSEKYQGLGITTGLGFLPVPQESGDPRPFFSSGVELNKTWGKGNWHPEVGFGLDYLRDSEIDDLFPRLTAAVRFQNSYSGFFFRPVISYYGFFQSEKFTLPNVWGGIGVGYTFD
ncbi:MAG: hypothetical protein AB8F94_20920 [Saprospiraceae bacterium]